MTKSQLSSILIKYFVSKNGNQWEFFVDGSVCKTGAFMAFFSTKIRLVDNANICFRVYVKLYQYRNNKSIKYSSNRCRKTALTRMLCGENSRKLSNFLTLTASAFSIAFDGPTSCSPVMIVALIFLTSFLFHRHFSTYRLPFEVYLAIL